MGHCYNYQYVLSCLGLRVSVKSWRRGDCLLYLWYGLLLLLSRSHEILCRPEQINWKEE
jgi:hypothetical protein